MKLFQTNYGYFGDNGKEYVITRPDTPKPWVNVICNGDYGLIISQTGGGYSWRTHAKFNRLTRWEQDLVKDEWGKYLYLRDNDTGDYWSLTWKPVCRPPERYECRHGLGYTTISSLNAGIESTVTFFVPLDEPLEVWY
ncbi:MAG: glycosyl transferase family 36, partial [Chloroflexi bacterium]